MAAHALCATICSHKASHSQGVADYDHVLGITL